MCCHIHDIQGYTGTESFSIELHHTGQARSNFYLNKIIKVGSEVFGTTTSIATYIQRSTQHRFWLSDASNTAKI